MSTLKKVMFVITRCSLPKLSIEDEQRLLLPIKNIGIAIACPPLTGQTYCEYNSENHFCFSIITQTAKNKNT